MPEQSARRRPTPPQSWLELFYDLAFVAAIVVVAGAYSNDYSLRQSGWLVVVFSLIWVTWLMAALLMERVDIRGLYQRGLLLTQMALVLLMAVTSDDFVQDNTGAVAPLFAGVLVTVLLLYRSAGRRGSGSVVPDWKGTRRLLLAVVIFVVLTWFSGFGYYLLWIIGLSIVWSTVRLQESVDSDGGAHVARRFGEFTIIMLGESFVKIGLVAAGEPLDRVDLFGLPLAFILVSVLWWLYFAEVAPAGLPPSPARRKAWVLMHFPLQLSIAALAVGLSKLLLPGDAVYPEERLGLITVPLIGAVLSIAVLDALGGTRAGRIRATALTVGACAIAVVGVSNVFLDGVEFDLGGAVIMLVLIMLAIVWVARRVADPVISEQQSGGAAVAE